MSRHNARLSKLHASSLLLDFSDLTAEAQLPLLWFVRFGFVVQYCTACCAPFKNESFIMGPSFL